MKKIYVTCGELAVVVQAAGPIAAIKAALKHSSQKVLADDYFYLDERGHRTGTDAQYKVPVEQALAEAGYPIARPVPPCHRNRLGPSAEA